MTHQKNLCSMIHGGNHRKGQHLAGTVQMPACGLYFKFTKLKLRLTLIIVDLNLNLHTSDPYGS